MCPAPEGGREADRSRLVGRDLREAGLQRAKQQGRAEERRNQPFAHRRPLLCEVLVDGGEYAFDRGRNQSSFS